MNDETKKMAETLDEETGATQPERIQPPAINGLYLTAKQYDVACHMAAGLTNKEIAPFLGITEDTVKFHVFSIIKKTGMKSRTGAIVKLIKHGLIDLKHVDI